MLSEAGRRKTEIVYLSVFALPSPTYRLQLTENLFLQAKTNLPCQVVQTVVKSITVKTPMLSPRSPFVVADRH